MNKISANLDASMELPGTNNSPSCYAGTLLVAGKGIGIIKTVGEATQLGIIGI